MIRLYKMFIFKSTKISKIEGKGKLPSEQFFNNYSLFYKSILKLRNKYEFVNKIITYFYNQIYIKILRTYFELDHNYIKYYNEPNLLDNKYNFNIVDGNKNDEILSNSLKYNNLLSTTMYYPSIKNKDLEFREKLKIDYIIIAYKTCLKNLNKNGNLLLSFSNFKLKTTFDLLYLGLLLFDNFIILGTDMVLYINFNPQISEDEFDNIIKKIKENKKTEIIYYDLDNLKNHFEYCNNTILKYIKYINISVDKFLDKMTKELFKCIFSFADYNSMIHIQTEIIQLFKRSPIKKVPMISSNVNKEEGKFLHNIIKKNLFKNVIEVGMAYGISSLYICSSLKETNGKLISIDPYQSSQWHNYGIKLIEKNELNNYHMLIENTSFVVLPELYNKAVRTNKYYDMVFIDGWHTFDYTLIDFFYADKLINIGGYIIIDDIRHNSIKQLVDYLLVNYKHYKQIKSPTTFLCLEKIDNDKRNWNFHINF